jgi:hypothetical protein
MIIIATTLTASTKVFKYPKSGYWRQQQRVPVAVSAAVQMYANCKISRSVAAKYGGIAAGDRFDAEGEFGRRGGFRTSAAQISTYTITLAHGDTS